MRGNFDYAVGRWRTDGSWHLDCNVMSKPNQRSKVFKVIWFVQKSSGPRCSTCLKCLKCGNEFCMRSLSKNIFVGLIFFYPNSWWPRFLHVTFTEGARTARRGMVARLHRCTVNPAISIRSFSFLDSCSKRSVFFPFFPTERQNMILIFRYVMFRYYQLYVQ